MKMFGINRTLVVFCLVLIICLATTTNGVNSYDGNQGGQGRNAGRKNIKMNRGERCIPIDCGLDCTKKGFTGSRCNGNRCICL
ncbi:hypothetical protein I4U23_004017 [Adineta vaga]|nr:hypothetical protein I4U23_004017 [Adineta vaga]